MTGVFVSCKGEAVKENAFVHRVLLRFEAEAQKVRADVSAIAHTPDNYIWIGSDELTTIERLSPIGNKEYGKHQPFAVGDYVDLKDTHEEIDIEGIDFSAGYLWVVGSHSAKRKRAKGKNAAKDIARLTRVVTDKNRCLLARLPIVNGVPVKQDCETGRSAAALAWQDGQSALLEMLKSDEHIGPIVRAGLPSKENGLDIEAIAVHEDRIFLGLRGPVLRGMAIILEIATEEKALGVLKLKELESKTGENKREGNKRDYRKHFVDLNGFGIRDLCFHKDDLIILAGPTMQNRSAMQIFRLSLPVESCSDTMVYAEDSRLKRLFDLPLHEQENAEGISVRLADSLAEPDALFVVHDSPGSDRLQGETAIWADVYTLDE